MKDEPAAAELLAAMADCLADHVMPRLGGPVRHEVRVIANLCRILSRESELGGVDETATLAEVAELVGFQPTDLAAAVSELDAAIASGDVSVDRETLAVLRRNVERRLAVNRPDYR